MTVQKFIASIDNFHNRLDGKLNRVVQGVSSLAAENMIVGEQYAPGTPVDTGFARASWWVRIDTPTRDKAGPVKGGSLVFHNNASVMLDEVSLTILGAKAGDIVYVLNDAEYIRDLEYGHSKQAPAGFVRLTAAAGQQMLDRVAKQVAHG